MLFLNRCTSHSQRNDCATSNSMPCIFHASQNTSNCRTKLNITSLRTGREICTILRQLLNALMRSSLLWGMASCQWAIIFIVCSTLEDDTNRPFRNTGHHSSSDWAQCLRKNEKPSTAPVRKHKTYEYIKVKKTQKILLLVQSSCFTDFQDIQRRR